MLAKDSSGGGDMKWLNPGCIWKVEMTGFADGSDIDIKIKTKRNRLGSQCGHRTDAWSKSCKSNNKNSERW